MIRRPPRSTQSRSSAASDVYKRQILSGWGDVSVFTADGQRELLLKGSVEKVRRQIGLFRVLLTVIAAIIMALILYTLTLDKIHSIALLKLIGAPNTVILGLILQQALILGIVGFGIAYLVGQQLFPMLPRRVILADSDLLQLAGIVLGISVLSSLLGRRVGPSTGTNFIGMLTLASEMRTAKQQGSIISLLCDSGERYLPTYHDAAWVEKSFGDCSTAEERIRALLA